MKTLQEIYTEIIGSEELKRAFAEAAKGGKVAEFLKAHGFQATAEEIKAFLKEKANGELTDEALNSVAGGVCNSTTSGEAVVSVVTLGTFCAGLGIASAIVGHTGQKEENEGRLCTKE